MITFFEKNMRKVDIIYIPITSCIVVFFFYWIRWHFISIEPYWLDEAFTAWFAKQSFTSLWSTVMTYETHPPIYYSLSKIFNYIIGEHIKYSERYMSFAISLFIIPISVKIIYLIDIESKSKKNASLIVAILTSISPLLSYYSIEARPYMFMVFIYALTIHSFFTLVVRNGSGVLAWFIFTFLIIITNWSHTLGSMYSFGVYIVLFIHFRYDKRIFCNALYSSFVAAIFTLPLLYLLIKPILMWSHNTWIPNPSFLVFLKNVVGILTGYPYVGIDSLLSPYGLFVATGIIIIAVTYCLMFLHTQTLSDTYSVYFIIFTLFFPVVSYGVSVFGPNVFLKRTMLPALIPFYIFVSIKFSLLKNVRIRNISLILLCIITIMFSILTLQAKKEPYDEIDKYLASTSNKDDVIILLPNSLELPIKYNMSSEIKGKLIPFPYKYPAIGMSSFYPDGSVAVPGVRNDDILRLNMLIGGAKSIFIVIRMGNVYDENKLLLSYISQNYSMTKSINYGNISIHCFTSSGVDNSK